MVHIYAVDITNLSDPLKTPEIMKSLPEVRKQKILKCKQPEARKQSLGAGLLLGYILKQYGLDAEDVKHGWNGKPEIEGICFNLSHSKNMVICAAAHKLVGCDIEQISKAPEKVANRFFCESEIKYLNELSEEKRKQEFYRLWTMKESYIKMTGEGMRLPLDKFEVNFGEDTQIYREGKKQNCFVKEYQLCQEDQLPYYISVCAEEKEFTEQIILKEWEELVDKSR